MGKKKNQSGRPPKRKTVVTYDAEARRDFLNGFSKRKKERQAKALEELRERAKADDLASRKQIREEQYEDRKGAIGKAAAAAAAGGASSRRANNGRPEKKNADTKTNEKKLTAAEEAEERSRNDGETDRRNLQELSGGSDKDVKTIQTVVEDDAFTKAQFGTGQVTVVTTTMSTGLDDDDEESNRKRRRVEEEQSDKSTWGKFSGMKNVKIPISDAARKIDRLTNKGKSRGKPSKAAAGSQAKVRSKKKKGKAGGKERRRRK